MKLIEDIRYIQDRPLKEALQQAKYRRYKHDPHYGRNRLLGMPMT